MGEFLKRNVRGSLIFKSRTDQEKGPNVGAGIYEMAQKAVFRSGLCTQPATRCKQRNGGDQGCQKKQAGKQGLERDSRLRTPRTGWPLSWGWRPRSRVPEQWGPGRHSPRASGVRQQSKQLAETRRGGGDRRKGLLLPATTSQRKPR